MLAIWGGGLTYNFQNLEVLKVVMVCACVKLGSSMGALHEGFKVFVKCVSDDYRISKGGFVTIKGVPTPFFEGEFLLP